MLREAELDTEVAPCVRCALWKRETRQLRVKKLREFLRNVVRIHTGSLHDSGHVQHVVFAGDYANALRRIRSEFVQLAHEAAQHSRSDSLYTHKSALFYAIPQQKHYHRKRVE